MAREPHPRSVEDLPDVITIPELSPLLRMSVSSAYDYARRGLLPVPVIRCGRRMYVSKAALLRVLDAQKSVES